MNELEKQNADDTEEKEQNNAPATGDERKCRHDWGYPSSGSCCSVYGYCCSQ